MPWERKGGGGIRIVSPPVPLTFCFETVGHLMDAVERAVHTLHVLSSALGRIGVTPVSPGQWERIAARSLFTEYGEYVGAGALTAAYIAERAETFIPNAAARMARYF